MHCAGNWSSCGLGHANNRATSVSGKQCRKRRVRQPDEIQLGLQLMELTDVARQCAGLDGIDSVYHAGDVGTDGSAQETPTSSSTSTGSLRICRPRRRSPKRDAGDTRHADRDTPKLPSQNCRPETATWGKQPYDGRTIVVTSAVLRDKQPQN